LKGWHRGSPAPTRRAAESLRPALTSDPFAVLMPSTIEQMPVAWRQLRIPGPPPALELSTRERTASDPMERFERRTIQRIGIACEAPDDAPTEQVALIDKASPHALFDLMVTDLSAASRDKPSGPTPDGVSAPTGRLIWQTAANFHRFVNDADVQHRFGLAGGAMNLALNCDPFTRDRESVQALKQFHIHLIYWRSSELSQLQRSDVLGDETDPYRSRQCLDPLSFIWPRLLQDCLPESDLAALGARLLEPDSGAVCAGRRPLGALLQLADWDQLRAPAFERLVRSAHIRIDRFSRDLLRCLTGTEHPPAEWQRHRLLPLEAIAGNLAASALSAENQAVMLKLAAALRDIPQPVLERLRHGPRYRRVHCMSLNQPCYSLSMSALPGAEEHADWLDHRAPRLNLQLKLFSGIGGAGLISLPGIPSVRVVRGRGCFSPADWRQRTEFQRAFAAYNSTALMQPNGIGARLEVGPVGRLTDLQAGWVR